MFEFDYCLVVGGEVFGDSLVDVFVVVGDYDVVCGVCYVSFF